LFENTELMIDRKEEKIAACEKRDKKVKKKKKEQKNIHHSSRISHR
tara:strand:+ start:358 stop:495 length:138 start_codon:yes stop_codon:yes gene_type:complete